MEITLFQDITALGLDAGLPHTISVTMIKYSNIQSCLLFYFNEGIITCFNYIYSEVISNPRRF